MRRLPPLSAVRVFEAAARHENFTAAAAELGMTQAAVSYQIRVLEERLATSLFLREKGRVSLSETGRRIAPLVASAFDALDDAFGLARTSGEAVLTVSCSTTFGPNWLAPRIGAFQLRCPDIAVRLQTSNALVDFGREDVDVAIRGGQGPWPGLVAHFLMRLPVMALASPGLLAGAPVRGPEDMLKLPRLNPDHAVWRHWSDEPPIGENGRGLRLDTQIAEGQAALAGLGAAVLNPILWQSELASGRLVPVFDAVAFEPGAFWLVYPESRRHAPKIRAFRDWLLAQVATEAAGDARGFYLQASGGAAAAA